MIQIHIFIVIFLLEEDNRQEHKLFELIVTIKKKRQEFEISYMDAGPLGITECWFSILIMGAVGVWFWMLGLPPPWVEFGEFLVPGLALIGSGLAMAGLKELRCGKWDADTIEEGVEATLAEEPSIVCVGVNLPVFHPLGEGYFPAKDEACEYIGCGEWVEFHRDGLVLWGLDGVFGLDSNCSWTSGSLGTPYVLKLHDTNK